MTLIVSFQVQLASHKSAKYWVGWCSTTGRLSAPLKPALAINVCFHDMIGMHFDSTVVEIRFRGRLAQLARASDLHSEGRGFEPLIAHHI